MVLLVRYLLLLALGLGSAIVFVGATATTARLLMYGGTIAAGHSDNIVIWVLAGAAFLGFISLIMYAFRILPIMMNRWFERYKDRITTIMLGLLVCLIFVLT